MAAAIKKNPASTSSAVGAAPTTIKLTKKDAKLLEKLSEDMKAKPEKVIKEALEALDRLEKARKKFGFGTGELRKGA